MTWRESACGGNSAEILEPSAGRERSCPGKTETVYTPEMVLGPARRGIKMTYCNGHQTDRIDRGQRQRDRIFLSAEGMYAEPEKLVKAKQYKHMTFYEAAAHGEESRRQGICG